MASFLHLQCFISFKNPIKSGLKIGPNTKQAIK